MPWIYKSCLVKGKQARPIVALISNHSDGRIIAGAIKPLGIDSIAGSSSRGGLEAIYLLVKSIRDGTHVAITPDGPKGPAGIVKGGIIKIAQKGGCNIYPVCIGYEKSWKFKSWDGMLLPIPFSRAVFAMGLPIIIPTRCSDDDNEYLRAQVELGMVELTNQADTFFTMKNQLVN